MGKFKWPFVSRRTLQWELDKLEREKNRQISALEVKLGASERQCRCYADEIERLKTYHAEEIQRVNDSKMIGVIDETGLAKLFNAPVDWNHSTDWPFTAIKANMFGYCRSNLAIGLAPTLRFAMLSALCKLFEPWSCEALAALLQLGEFNPTFMIGGWHETEEVNGEIAIELCPGQELEAAAKLIVFLPISSANAVEIKNRYSELWASPSQYDRPAQYVETDRFLIFPLDLNSDDDGRYCAWLNGHNPSGCEMSVSELQEAKEFFNECIRSVVVWWATEFNRSAPQI